MVNILPLMQDVYCGVLFGVVPLKTTQPLGVSGKCTISEAKLVTMGDPAVWLLKLDPRIAERRRHALNPRPVRRRR